MLSVRPLRLCRTLLLGAVLLGCADEYSGPSNTPLLSERVDGGNKAERSLQLITVALRSAATSQVFRDSLLSVMSRSRESEAHATSFSSVFGSGGNDFLRGQLAEALGELRNLDELLAAIPPLRLEMPSAEHRNRWMAGSDVHIVPSFADMQLPREVPVAQESTLSQDALMLFVSARPVDQSEAAPVDWLNSGPSGALGTLVSPRAGASPTIVEDPCDLDPFSCPPDPGPGTPPGPDPAQWANAPAGVYIESLNLGYQGTLLPQYTEELGPNLRIEVQAVANTGSPADPEVAWTCAASHKRDRYSIQWNRSTKSYENSGLVDVYSQNSNGQFVYAGRQRAGLLLAAADIDRFGQFYNADNNPLMVQIWEDDNAIPYCGDRGKAKTESDLKSLYSDFKVAGMFYKLATKPSPLSVVFLSGDVLYSLLTPQSHQYPDEMLGSAVHAGRVDLPDGTVRMVFELRAPPRVWESATGPTGGTPNGTLTLRFVGVSTSVISQP